MPSLNPFQYERAAAWAWDMINKHIAVYVLNYNSRTAQHIRTIKAINALNEDQKTAIIEFIEKMQSKSIANAMMRGEESITVPRIGKFVFSAAKFYMSNNKEELATLSYDERRNRIVNYHITHKPKKRFSNFDGKKISFTKAVAKR